MIANFAIEQGCWPTLQSVLIPIRTAVFIHEQCVPEDMEWDAYDADALHFVVRNAQQNPIACARLVEASACEIKLGRMAVLKAYRHRGVGRALLEKAIQVSIQQGRKKVTLSAQTHAIAFYQASGFKVDSGEYLDAGILHVDMVRRL